MLRIDVDNGTPYAIPPDNPYVGRDGLDEIWAIGLRNPWRLSFDDANGDLWIADVGQNAQEEVDLLVAGGNYGWRYREGNAIYRGTPVLDLDYDEDSKAKADANFVLSGRGGIVEIQATAEDEPFTADELAELFAANSMRVHGFLRDERMVAGIGRRLANEVCHRARGSPFATTKKLGADGAASVARAADDLRACLQALERGDVDAAERRPADLVAVKERLEALQSDLDDLRSASDLRDESREQKVDALYRRLEGVEARLRQLSEGQETLELQTALLSKQAEQDDGTNRNKKHAQQQPLERIDVAFQLVSILAVREHHARQEGAQCGRQADNDHQQCDCNDQQQGRRGKQFPQPGNGDEAENGTDEKRAHDHDERDGPNGQQRALPRVQAIDELGAHALPLQAEIGEHSIDLDRLAALGQVHVSIVAVDQGARLKAVIGGGPVERGAEFEVGKANQAGSIRGQTLNLNVKWMPATRSEQKWWSI